MAALPSPLEFRLEQVDVIEEPYDGDIVQRSEGHLHISSFFSTRPVRINEKICFRFKEMTGSIRYGFTRNDPSILNLLDDPQEFFASPGCWSKKLSRSRFCKTDTVWEYYVNTSGDVHIERNGRDERVHFSKIDVKEPFWAMLILVENTSLEFIEPSFDRERSPAERTDRELVINATAEATSSGTRGLRFHNVYAGNIVFLKDGSVRNTKREEYSFMFGNRPVKINEMVCLSFTKIGDYAGFIFGFTRCEPGTVRMPISLSTDTHKNNGYYCESLEDEFLKQDNILHFHVNSSGDIQYGVNGTDIEIICSGINTNVPLWVVIQLWPNSSVKFIDSVDFLRRLPTEDSQVQALDSGLAISLREQTVLSSRYHTQTSTGSTNNEQNQSITRQPSINNIPTTNRHQPACSNSENTVSRPSANTAVASNSQSESSNSSRCLGFHPVHGENIELSRDGSTVRCGLTDAIDGIAFSANPIQVNEVVAFRILETNYTTFGIGFTRNDPVDHDIPDTVAFLGSPPPGYWISCLDSKFCKRDNVCYFYISNSGDVHIGVNGRDVRVHFSVSSPSYTQWGFVEIWGDTVLQYIDPRTIQVGPPAKRTPLPLVQAASADAICPSFHEVHGDQVSVSNDGFILQSRLSPYEKRGVAFSNRPIGINETINILFVDVGNPSNFLAFGFTKHNPATVNTLPDNITNDENNTSGYWANYLDPEICINENILNFHVNAAGQIQYGINGTNTGIYCAGIESRKPLWAVVQIRPNNSTIKFIDRFEAEERLAVEEIRHNDYENLAINQDDDLNIGQILAEREENEATSHHEDTENENQELNENVNIVNATLTSSHYQPSAPPETECIICTEVEANTVFFACGHICTCYECAEQLWRGSGNGTCPICRAVIQQILRTYR